MDPVPMDDPHDLERFVDAQRDDYDHALSEIAAGHKRTHWMWYVFPQVAGLGSTSNAKDYAIRSKAEALAYVGHPVLGPRLLEIAQAALAVSGRTAREIFGSPDDAKLRSCATLFASVLPTSPVFDQLLVKYFAGVRDERTIHLLETSIP